MDMPTVRTSVKQLKRNLVPLQIRVLLQKRLFVAEPGYYEEGAFGIRHENLCVVVNATTEVSSLFLTTVFGKKYLNRPTKISCTFSLTHRF